ncbi:CBS domain-containing protein [Amycolatopsis sp. NPDC051903]|uniref:CBS domain-containing protein n=1 Tax=Amycolatopsis sp. NPDC051903 TaxID=3363936 RepID=UPI003797BF18
MEQIGGELAQRGLSTKPSFTDGNINSRIAVLPVGAEPNAGVVMPTAEELPAESAPEDQPVALLVKQLPSAEVALASARPDEALSVAMTRMAIDNFSQLPVLDDERRLLGAITWESVGVTYLSSNAPTLEQVITGAREADGDDDLLDWIPEVYRRGFILVRDRNRRVQGIITTADLTSQLGNQLRPFLLVAEIERRLRRIVGRVLGDGTVSIDQVRGQLRSNRRRQVQEENDLTIGEYPYVFDADHTWQALRWGLDRRLFLDRPRTAAQFRNNLMHLNPDMDSESESELLPLHGLLGTLRALDR